MQNLEKLSNSSIMPPAHLRPAPFDTGPIYFVGIGGVGMSGIAETMLKRGYKVMGYDSSASANTERLEALGAKVSIGHDGSDLSALSAVVYSTAIKAGNPVMLEARAHRIPILHRAEMLAELMRSYSSIAVGGTHGKTTTTSLVAALLDAGGLDPTVVNGGIINAYGTNAKIGVGNWMVVEADESDGSFLKLNPSIAIVTNIDREHLAYYGDMKALTSAFRDFINNIPFYGFAIVCADDPVVREMITHISDRRLISYGSVAEAQVRVVNITMDSDGASFTVHVAPHESSSGLLERLRLPVTGHHNVLNSLAAIAVAWELGVTENAIRRGLSEFGGVKRRFTTTGIAQGVRVVDDNARNPAQISATLSAAREVQSGTAGKVMAIVQPIRYTRLHNLLHDFCSCLMNADAVIVADIRAAGESPIDGVDKHTLVDALRRSGHCDAVALPAPSALAALVAERTQPGDLVVCLGAGDTTTWAYALPDELNNIAESSSQRAAEFANFASVSHFAPTP
jgi:UDP-N-acetylmuramate--alanine ligase